MAGKCKTQLKKRKNTPHRPNRSNTFVLENKLALPSTLPSTKYIDNNYVTHTDSELPIIQQYFDAGHKYDVILDTLLTFHDIRTSVRTLKTRLKETGLFRRTEIAMGGIFLLPEI